MSKPANLQTCKPTPENKDKIIERITKDIAALMEDGEENGSKVEEEYLMAIALDSL